MNAYPNTYLMEQKSGIDWAMVLPAMDYLYTQEQPLARIRRACRETLYQYLQEGPELAAADEREMDAVRAAYVFEDSLAVESFLTGRRAIAGLLLEAAPYLRKCFGADIPLRLRVRIEEEDGARRLEALALWNGPLREAKNALAAFDREWWLQNCRRGSGSIVLDYELV
jgi:hypothetical protein